MDGKLNAQAHDVSTTDRIDVSNLSMRDCDVVNDNEVYVDSVWIVPPIEINSKRFSNNCKCRRSLDVLLARSALQYQHEDLAVFEINSSVK